MIHDSFSVMTEENGTRLDVFLAGHLCEEISRSKVKECIKKGGVTVNDQTVITPNHRVHQADDIFIAYEQEKEMYVEPQDIPLDIRYEDDDIIVVNKQAGLVVHPAPGNKEHTLVNAVLFHSGKLSTVGEMIRPGIVHRIDKDTSGLLVVAKTDKAHMELAKQFKDHTISRCYYAIVKGVVQHDQGRCDASIGQGKMFRKKMVVEAAEGRHAVTYFSVVERFRNATLLELQLETGRTHQIRVHMAHMGYPVLGDTVYGVSSRFISRQALHAVTLGFIHPVSEEYMEFTADMPADMQSLVDTFRAEMPE